MQVTGIEWMPNEITAMPADVTEVPAMIYNMNVGEGAAPSDYYMDTIRAGLPLCGIPCAVPCGGGAAGATKEIKAI